MRLLKTHANTTPEAPLNLEEFPGQDIPQYAILSHTWGKDEVLFDHIGSSDVTSRLGFAKVKRAVEQARNDGFQYVWVDTCCIDKSSSAELSEAINSMYQWYSSSAICYAYLEDVSIETHPPNDQLGDQTDFARSRWFTRGWCLQELLAPKTLVFYSSNWCPVGDKHSLRHRIASITHIDTEILSGKRSIESVSIAARMSWASSRVTTRIEDTAYCLMGIFSVNMPMLYGEGKRAFYRLQEEIMRTSTDDSLFAWKDLTISRDEPHGLLADSPAVFAESAEIIQPSVRGQNSSFEMTSKGLRIRLASSTYPYDVVSARLNCTPISAGPHKRLSITLLHTGSDNYGRIRCNDLGVVPLSGTWKPKTIYVDQRLFSIGLVNAIPFQFLIPRFSAETMKIYETIGLVQSEMTGEEYYRQVEAAGIAQAMDDMRWCLKLVTSPGHLSAAILLRQRDKSRLLAVMLGYNVHAKVGVGMMEVTTVPLAALPVLQRNFHPFASTSMYSQNHVIDATVKMTREGIVIVYDVMVAVAPLNAMPNSTSQRRAVISSGRSVILPIE